MRRRAIVAVVTIFTSAALALAAACGASDATSAYPGTSGSSGSSDAGANTDSSSPIGDAGAVPINANGIVLVHAASFPAFRICFDATANEQPIPATEVMPGSNLVGVDVGTAVRLAPRPGPLGKAHIFAEEKIRSLYFNVQKGGPRCGELLQLGGKPDDAIEVATDLPDLSSGTHLLVLRGCAKQALDPQASVARCGPKWSAESGNLELEAMRVPAFTRPSATKIPFQIVQLSRDLDERAKSRALGLTFGELDGGPAPPLVEGAVPFSTPVPNPPAFLDYAEVGMADFASNGIFVTLGGAIDDAGLPVDAGDAGPREVVLAQSLADIQRRSSARSLPPDWFSTASSYVVLSIGEIDPKTPDGGPGDERRALHLLAIPLATPDAGPDASQ